MRYAHPGTPGALVSFKSAYGNYIDGQFVEPLGGEYFMNTSPVDGSDIAQFPRSDAKDIDFALDAAHRAAEAWGKTSVQHRSNLLLQVADRIQENLEYLAIAESWDNGKPVRETLNADLPLAVDHFRYFAGCLRAQEGSTAEIDETTVAYHFHEPLGVSANYSVELSAADGGLEAGAGAGGRELCGAQAGRADAAEHHAAAGNYWRPLPAGRPERGAGLR